MPLEWGIIMHDWYYPVSGAVLDVSEFIIVETAGRIVIAARSVTKGGITADELKWISRDPQTISTAMTLSDVSFELVYHPDIDQENDNGAWFIDIVLVFMTIKSSMRLYNTAMMSCEVDKILKCAKGSVLMRSHRNPILRNCAASGTLTRDHLQWIERNIDSLIDLMKEKPFMNSLDALRTAIYTDNPAIVLILAWSGLEALFRVAAEHTFKLSLAISYFIGADDKKSIFSDMKKSYNMRSRFVHGSANRNEDITQISNLTFDILCRCLAKSVEQKGLPDIETLLF